MKSLKMILLLCITASLCVTASAANYYQGGSLPSNPGNYVGSVYGDVNMDSRITASDARLALRMSARLAVDLPVNAGAAETAPKTGEVTAESARKILRISARLEKPPVQRIEFDLNRIESLRSGKITGASSGVIADALASLTDYVGLPLTTADATWDCRAPSNLKVTKKLYKWELDGIPVPGSPDAKTKTVFTFETDKPGTYDVVFTRESSDPCAIDEISAQVIFTRDA